MARADQDASFAGYQRQDVPGTGEVVGRRVVARQRLNGVGALVGGDPRRQADLVVHGHRVGGRQGCFVAGHHGIQVQALGVVLGDRGAEDAAGVADHEADLVGRGLGRRHDQVALVLAVVVVHDHDQLARRDGGDGVVDGVEFSGHVVIAASPGSATSV